MRKIRVVACLGFLAVIVAVALTGSPVASAGPTPDCGPNFEWDCTMPDGSHQAVDATRCEISAFQKQTGAHCVLSGW
jgi:hypothetical protein